MKMIASIFLPIFLLISAGNQLTDSIPDLAICSDSQTGSYSPIYAVTPDDADLIDFALNLEYLEAEFFLWSAFGYGLSVIAPELNGHGPEPFGVQLANLDPQTRDITEQLALQEVGHVRAIRGTVIGFPRPLLDVSKQTWAAIMDRAFGMPLLPPFDPYEDSLKFLIASYAIPYVGLTGYVGANPRLSSSTAKRLVAGLLGVESGQDAIIRAALYNRRNETVLGYRYTVAEFTEKISVLRNTLGRTGNVDEGIEVPPCLGAEGRLSGNVLAADRNSLSFARTPEEILRILYGTGSEFRPGGFYPRGANGEIARKYLL